MTHIKSDKDWASILLSNFHYKLVEFKKQRCVLFLQNFLYTLAESFWSLLIIAVTLEWKRFALSH